MRFLLKITALRFLGHSFFVFYVFGLTWNVFLHFFVSRCLRTSPLVFVFSFAVKKLSKWRPASGKVVWSSVLSPIVLHPQATVATSRLPAFLPNVFFFFGHHELLLGSFFSPSEFHP